MVNRPDDSEVLPDPQPLRCQRCAAVLGTSLGTELLIGPVRVRQVLHFECGRCGFSGVWQPDPTTSDITSDS